MLCDKGISFKAFGEKPVLQQLRGGICMFFGERESLAKKKPWFKHHSYQTTNMWKRYSKTTRIWEVPWQFLGAIDTDYYFPGLTGQIVSDINASQCLLESICIRSYQAQDVPSPFGFIQLFLLKTAPFDFDGALSDRRHMIQDIRTGQKHACDDRPQLLQSLAVTLRSFHRKLHRRYVDTEKRLWKMQRCPKDIGEVLTIYFDLRTQGILTPKPGMKHLHRKTVEQAYETVAAVINAFTPEDYAEIVRYSTSHVSDDDAKLDLITQMWRCFEDYAPKRYLKDANYHAIAAILRKFMIEDGDQSTVVHRIRKRLQRASE